MSATTFADLGVSEAVVATLREGGITEAFPIQSATIEAALAGRDICGKAPTGSGKTLAFGVPAVELCNVGTQWRPSVLILSPTRELATQIKDELEPLAKAKDRTILTVFGGTNIERDIRELGNGVDILVACPGRLEDLIARRCCELRNVEIVIVDEADRMADMGFLPSVKRLLDQTPGNRHTLLFSATLDGDVDMLIKRYQNDPLTFEVDEEIGEIGDVEHSWYLVQPVDRIPHAVAVLKRYQSAIVFCRTRRGCERVAKIFAQQGLAAVAIHGDRSQHQRERALAEFTSGKAHVLVATDVAARGIHVDNVALVMHYDPAGTDKDYIHRSGRTGRAGQEGRVISMVVEDKKKAARQLQRDLRMKPGLKALDLASLGPVAERRKPEPETKKQDGPRDDRFDRPEREGGRSRSDRDDRGERSGGGGGRKRSDRDDRGGRSERGGSRNRSDRDDRGGRGERSGGNKRSDRDDQGSHTSRRAPRRRPGSNDWYPPGHYDDDNKRGGKPGGKQGSSSSSRGRDDRKGRKTEREEPPAGGRGTTQRKNRGDKGRHADKASTKNKGKRRKPPSR